MVNYFLDTEFHNYRTRTGEMKTELISIGLCTQTKYFYAVSNEFDIECAMNNEWLRENVIQHLNDIPNMPMSLNTMKKMIQDFITEEDVDFYAYYGARDWCLFTDIFGGMLSMPSNYPMYAKDLKQMIDECADIYMDKSIGSFKDRLKIIKNMPNYPKQELEHVALYDAEWNMDLYNFLMDEFYKKVGILNYICI